MKYLSASNPSFVFSDVDECAKNTHGCSDTCINTPGSFVCECKAGYSLGIDEKTCAGNLKENDKRLCFLILEKSSSDHILRVWRAWTIFDFNRSQFLSRSKGLARILTFFHPCCPKLGFFSVAVALLVYSPLVFNFGVPTLHQLFNFFRVWGQFSVRICQQSLFDAVYIFIFR